MGEFGKCSRDPLGGRSLDTELAIQQSATDLVDQGERASSLKKVSDRPARVR